MTVQFDPSTRDLTNIRFKIADDLVFTPQVHDEEVWYHIESPRKGTFYRVGYPEYVFISLLDGKLTIAQALTITARSLGARALTQHQGKETVLWLLRNGLASQAEGNADRLLSAHLGRTPVRSSNVRQNLIESRIGKKWNPFNLKLPLGSPDRLLFLPVILLGWVFSGFGIFVGFLLILCGGVNLATQWSSFSASAAQVFAPHNWWTLVGCWLILKFVHELAHAVACRRYGGEVRDAGLIFVLFAPMAYVDVTSCWRFPSKWQRIHVAAAGIYVELVISAVAAIVWCQSDSEVARHLLHNVIVSASASTVVFNANPLMRFDGYYILADLLEIPNLATEGTQFVRELIGRIFYGTRLRPLQRTGLKLWYIRIYGVSSAAWRIAVCLSLAVAASALLNGAGLVLAWSALAAWFGLPLWQAGKHFVERFHESPLSCVRAAGVAIVLAGSLAGLFIFVPLPATVTAPVVVEYADAAIVRNRSSGFVEHIYVVDGQRVDAGEPLLELRNDDLRAKLREQELEVAKEELQSRIALERHDAAAAQVASRNLVALKQRLDEVGGQVDGLRICAPISGQVIGHGLEQQRGVFLKEGCEVLTIGDESRKQLTLSAGQEEIESLLPLIGQETTFRVSSRPPRHGQLSRLEPRASLQIPHPAFSAVAGGPLAVTAGHSSESSLRLTEPRFRGAVTLSSEAGRDLGVGERGYATLGWRQERIGEFVWIRVSRWMEALLTPKGTSNVTRPNSR